MLASMQRVSGDAGPRARGMRERCRGAGAGSPRQGDLFPDADGSNVVVVGRAARSLQRRDGV